ncbi:MAG: GSCFA domain-containing protein [Crocinitomicaceae bacterium]|nr:GSCFA domain-containing protein [Crocinitomicaceae bacterium]
MELQLKFEIPKSNIELSYSDAILLIGSCFSDSIGDKFEQGGFTVESNTFGTLFHPIAISNIMHSALTENTVVDVFQRDDLYFSWDSASKIYATSEAKLIETVLEKRNRLAERIKSSRLICIALGTAWEYKLKSSETVVGNCHKAPQNLFEKSLSTIDEMRKEWERVLLLIRSFNPTAKIVFTVSPVRHVKDGLIENNRSKARLMELIQQLSQSNKLIYFPSYEIAIDELRDYRFYEEDLVHPNKTAIEYIWKRFVVFAFSDNTTAIYQERNQFIAQLNHKSLHPESEVDKKRLELVGRKLKEFGKRNPDVLI